jgi:hypothetical protein
MTTLLTSTSRVTKFAVFALAIFSFFLVAETLEARRGGRRGGSFGGSRRSRSYSKPRTSKPKSSTQKNNAANRSTAQKPKTSFGGKRMNSAQQYRKSYGTPRKTEKVSVPGQAGKQYTVNRYGGMSDGFMMGYMMGTTSMWWSTPFHPAFYFSRPHYVAGPNGAMDVYPPTFSWFKLLMTLAIVGAIVYFIAKMMRARKGRPQQVHSGGGSFG